MTTAFRLARRTLSTALALLPLLGLLPAASHGQSAEAATWPDRPIKLVVPFPPGSVTDRLARTLGQKLEGALKQPVVVENKPGAGATLGSDFVAKSKPDGYTILLGANASHAVNVTLMKLPYDPVKSFAPISLVAAVPSVLMVNPDVPANTLGEFLAQAKAKPGGISYTSAGVGTTGHIGMEMLASMAGVQLLHVPGKGPGAALQDVMGGHVNALIESIALSQPLVKSNKLKALAVTSTERAPTMPQLPTMAEAGVPGYELLLWFALYAPAGTPPAIVQRFTAETQRAFADPAVRNPLLADGLTLVASSPEKLAEFQRSETEKYARIVKAMGIAAN